MNVTNKCTICKTTFSKSEGGIDSGLIGMIPVSFCPTCLNGILEMVSYMYEWEEVLDEDL